MQLAPALSSLVLYVFLIGFSQFLPAQTTVFSTREVQEDIAYLREHLEKHHPNLYLYSDPAAFKDFWDQLDKNLPEQSTHTEVYRQLSPVLSLIKDGHTLMLPAKKLRSDSNRDSLFFPFDVFCDGRRLWTLGNYSDSLDLLNGSEILSLNGTPTSQLIASLMKRLARDGHNPQYALWVLNRYFRSFYSFVWGHPKSFTLEVKEKDAPGQILKVPAMKRADIGIRAREKDSFSKDPAYPPNQSGIQVKKLTAKNTALLSLPSFSNRILKARWGQKFRKEVRKCFSKLNEWKVEHLYLDLRENQGGDIRLGRFLLSYLLESDFSLISGYQRVHRGKPSATQRLKVCKGPQEGIFPVQKDRFRGKVSVLINGGTFSNSAIVCAALKKYHRATFIGEESGGSRCVLAGAAKEISLPHSHIQVQIPRLQFRISGTLEPDCGGLQPDSLTRLSIEDILSFSSPD